MVDKKSGDGTPVTAVGPVSTHYEFGLVGTRRLNDDEWKQMLAWNNRTKYLPEWFSDIYGEEEPSAPEYPNTIVLVVVLTFIVTMVAIRKGVRVRKKLVSCEPL